MDIRKAIIPAAGFGTRFLPATKALPKEMLTVVDKPLIQYCVEEVTAAGIRSIAIVISRGKRPLEDHFDRSPELEEFLRKKGKLEMLEEVKKVSGMAEFVYIRQPEALGLGHAILMGEKYISGEPFAVLNPDNIYDCAVPCIKQVMDVFSELKATVIAVGRVEEQEARKCGIIKPRKVRERLFEVEDTIEKPGPGEAFSDLGILGRYVFTPEIFEAIRKTPPDNRGEIQITDAIKTLGESHPVYGYLFEGRRYDAGDKLGYLEATIAQAMKRPEFREKLQEIFKAHL